MPAVINTNMASLYAQRSLSTSQAEMAVQVNALASGKRINSARDDGAGLAVSEAAKSSNSIATRSIQNIQDGISIVQIADGSLNVVGKILQRVLTLATQKENSVLSTNQKSSINTEIASLLNEIEKIRSRSQFQNNGSVFNTNKSFSAGDGVSTNVNIAYLGLGDDVARSTYAQFESIFSKNFGVPSSAQDLGSDSDYAEALLHPAYGMVSPTSVGDTLYFGDNIAGNMFITAAGDGSTVLLRIQGNIFTMTGSFKSYQLANGRTLEPTTYTMRNAFTNAPVMANGSDQLSAEDWMFGSFTFGRSRGLSLVDTYQQPLAQVARDGLIAYEDYYSLSTDRTVRTVKALTADAVANLSSANIKMAIGRNTNNMAEVGTTQNRLGYIVDNLQTLSNNLIDAQGRITDVDYASVTAGFTRGLILQQAGSAMVAQANQSGRVMLALLK